MSILFAQSVQRCLKLISADFRPGKTSSRSLGLRFRLSLERYGKLRAIVQHFNALFSSTVLKVKGLCLINICLLIYTPLNVNFETAKFGIVLFVASAFFLSLKICWILISLGSVDTQSTCFRLSWIAAFPDLLADAEPENTQFLACKEQLLHQDNIKLDRKSVV